METAIATVVDRSFEGTQNAHCLIKDSPFWLPHLEAGYLAFSVSVCVAASSVISGFPFFSLSNYSEKREGETEQRRVAAHR